MISLMKNAREWYRLCVLLAPLPAACIAGFFHYHTFVLRSDVADSFCLELFFYTAILWPLLAKHYRLSSVEEFGQETTGLTRPVRAVAMVFLVESAITTLGKLNGLSRAYYLETFIALFLVVVVLRETMRALVVRGNMLRRETAILVIGTDSYAWRVSRRLMQAPLSIFRPVAFVRLPGQDVRVKGYPVYEVERILAIPPQFEEIVVAVQPEHFGAVSEILGPLQEFSKPIHAAFDLGTKFSIQEKLFTLGRLQLLDLGFAPTESFAYSVLKRIFDVTFAMVALTATLPLLSILALMVRLTSPGPILFRQERVGLNGTIFEMLKFRTMRVAESSKSDTLWTTENDPRRTAIGAFLRKTSLDELPQLFNVLKGDMSMVGPRPERPYFVSKFRQEIGKYNFRHNVKVGITGWAQVNGLRGDTSIRRRLRYDLYYVQNWNLMFDIRIIVQTFRALWKGQNAY